MSSASTSLQKTAPFLIFRPRRRFIKDNHKSTVLSSIAFYKYVRNLLDGLQAYHNEQNREKIPTFELFFATKIQQTKNRSQCIMSLFMSTKRPFNYSKRNKAKKLEAKLEMRKKCSVLKVKRNFSRVKTGPSKKGVLSKHALLDTPQKESVKNK